ncbi:alpha/beta-hydrolase [Violaceomyces palustris]|uniref:Alpha/beta-hydrolase n=1 Tax=Violaceomyces palustris TaxID=1673888 RepID=A0ACD0NU39_9BASI|nr:alpha/beta-hydrolase [Violaceomyces palustris]
MRSGILFNLNCLVAAITSVTAASLSTRTCSVSTTPSVKLSQGTVNGFSDQNSNVDLFLGIPYAKPPVGDLRFKKPVPVDQDANKVIEATSFGATCYQGGSRFNLSEDCLFVNVFRPSGVDANQKLPVLLWIYGGAFLSGSTSTYNATNIVAESVRAGNPIIFASVNYRLNAFGFLASEEIAKASKTGDATLNAGLWDQRLGMRWLQENIRDFGGDPKKVTIYGESAGAISASIHLLANGGNQEGLFRAAILQSGSPASGTIIKPDHPQVEKNYAGLSALVGCQDGGHNYSSTLECLRNVEAPKLLNATSTLGAQSMTVAPPVNYLINFPVIDGYFFTDRPTKMIAKGEIADVPIITGDCLDEGTNFTPSGLVNETVFKTWFEDFAVAYPNDTNAKAVLEKTFELYPDEPAQGSPFNNPATNVSAGSVDPNNRFYQPASTNQFKRGAALWGDYIFQGSRRVVLKGAIHKGRKSSKKVWTYLFSQRDIGVSRDAQGAYHGSDVVYIFGNTPQRNSTGLVDSLHKTMLRSWISFTHHLDPTKIDQLNWPVYDQKSKAMIQFKGENVTLIKDDYREEAISYLVSEEASAVYAL